MNKNKKHSALVEKFGLLTDEPMKQYTSFKVGGPADLFAQPTSIESLIELLKEAAALDLPITVMGGGCNLLVTDKGIRGLVITTRKLKSRIVFKHKDAFSATLKALAGEPLAKVCKFALTHKLSGLEFTAGIPGTLGGAVMMNIGIGSKEISAIIESVDVLDLETYEINKIKKQDLNFSYRQADIPGILLAVTMNFSHKTSPEIRVAMSDYLEKKHNTQPIGVASAGCFFKNPDPENPAGLLIDKAGLKGTKVNGAKISEVHANYIVNEGGATCEDILKLKEKVQKTILEKYKINLETEVRLEGE